jgi:ABC-type uncharacterized transport system ATPase subunit
MIGAMTMWRLMRWNVSLSDSVARSVTRPLAKKARYIRGNPPRDIVNRVRMLSISHLQKRFGERIAVYDVSFEVAPGETIGLLGPNGAGKTTTLSLISGLAQADSGSVSFQGQFLDHDANQLKRRTSRPISRMSRCWRCKS